MINFLSVIIGHCTALKEESHFRHSANVWSHTVRGQFKNLVQPLVEAVTEMIPDLIWAPEFFGPKDIQAPDKFRPRMKIIIWQFYAVTNILGAQISRDPNFLGLQKVRGSNDEMGDHFRLSCNIRRTNFLVGWRTKVCSCVTNQLLA